MELRSSERRLSGSSTGIDCHMQAVPPASTMIKLVALITCCGAIPVTFKVGFQGRQVALEGPHLAGSFQGWDPAANALADGDGDGIYETTLDLPPGSHEFKFFNGSSLQDTEALPPACSTETYYDYWYGYGPNEDPHRKLEIVEGATSVEVHVCYQECEPCDALSRCEVYNCPSHLLLKESALEVPGETRATCCENMLNWREAVVVRSAGYSDGNQAEFWMNGERIHSTGARGLTVVEVRPELLALYMSYGYGVPVKHKETFDTYVDSSKLEAYLSSVPAGNLLLMAAVDEASTMLSPQAEALIATFGAENIQQMGFRSSYALIGQKNGSALSEVVSPEGNGLAVAVAAFPMPQPLKFCKMHNCFWGIFHNVLRADTMETPGRSDEACCERARPGEQSLVVRSAGFSDGNRAEFRLNGQLLYATRTRGLTVVDLWPDMTVKHRETFDTFTDSSALVAYLSSTAEGNIILVAAVDEASAGFSQEAANLLRDCGATFPQPLAFRSSYALIGIKGGQALSEVVMPELTGYAVAVAEVTPPEPVQCKLYNCPKGFLLRVDAKETLGASPEACCVATGAGKHAVLVRSAGYNDGNKAEFWLNGELLHETSARGLTVVDLWPDMTVKHIETFDTHLDVSAFIACLSSTAEGNMILVGAADEASAKLGKSYEAANLLRACGATFPRPISWRSSYALIGIKGGQAFSEEVRASGDGKAVAVAEVATATTTTTTKDRFAAVDGGVGRACRGSSAGDNKASYYTVVSGVTSLLACKEECLLAEACVGIEHSGSRCEVWTREEAERHLG